MTGTPQGRPHDGPAPPTTSESPAPIIDDHDPRKEAWHLAREAFVTTAGIDPCYLDAAEESDLHRIIDEFLDRAEDFHLRWREQP